MNRDAFAAISGAVATLAVTTSVTYLTPQVKTSVKAPNPRTYRFATQALGEMAAIVGAGRDLSRICVRGIADPDSIEEEEYYQFSYLTISLIRRYENIFYEWQSGMIDEDFGDGRRNNLLWFHFRPVTQRWWSQRRGGLSVRFRSFLDSQRPDACDKQPERFV